MDGEPLIFASRDSVTIATLNGTGKRVLWALNRRDPKLLHLLTADGAYIESIPQKGESQWFSQDEASQAAYGDAQAQIQRDLRRFKELHADDAAAAGADAVHNAAQIHRLVQTFPTAQETQSAPLEFEKGSRIVAAMENGTAQRNRRVASRIPESEIADLLGGNSITSPEQIPDEEISALFST